MNSNLMNLTFVEKKTLMPEVRFKFEVFAGSTKVADIETQIDKGYFLEGERDIVYTIYKMVVKSKYRHKGIGSQIIKYCENLAIEKELKKLVVLVHPLDKDISVNDLKNFYQQNGMRFIPDNGLIFGVKQLDVNK